MERAYKTMTSSGGMNIAFGIVMIVIGITSGVITIVNGARLLKHRGEITSFRAVRPDRTGDNLKEYYFESETS